MGAEKAGKGRRNDFGLSGAARTRAPNAALCRPFRDGETRTRTGDTTIFSRGSTTGECGPFPATTRGAVAGLRAHTFPRFPRDCGVFGRRFSDLCLNSVAAERAQPGGVTAFAVRRNRLQSKPLGPLRPGELDVHSVVLRQLRG